MRVVLALLFLAALGAPARADACWNQPTRDCILDKVLAASAKADTELADRIYARGVIGALRNDEALIAEALKALRDAKGEMSPSSRINVLSEMAGIAGNARWFREALALAERGRESSAQDYGAIARNAARAGMLAIATEAVERIARERGTVDWFILGRVYDGEKALAALMSTRGLAAALDFLDRPLARLSPGYRLDLLHHLALRLVDLGRLDEAEAVRRHIGQFDVADHLAVTIAAARGGAELVPAEGQARRIRDEVLRFRALAALAAAKGDAALSAELVRLAQATDRPAGLLADLAVAQAKSGAVDAALATVERIGAAEKGWQAQALFEIAVVARRADLTSRALKLSYPQPDAIAGFELGLLMRRARQLWQ